MDARASRYQEVYARSQRDPQAFWSEAAADIDWIEWPKQVFDPKAGVYGRWFTDGVCNTCWNAVDRHVLAGRGEQAAIIYDSPLAGQKLTITYHRLQVETQVLAAILRNLGVAKGDRVVLYMPMVPEAVIGMLACARIGAVHSVVFGGFAAKELATRIDDAKPKVMLSASCGLEVGRIVNYKPLLDEAIRVAGHKPEACLILQRPQGDAALVPRRDHDWAKLRDEAIVFARSVYDCVPVAATDPLYILYTSGTTGIPKGVVRDNGGHLVALTSAGWSATATSSMRRCCMAAPPSSTKASRWARLMPARFGASSPSIAALPCSRRRRRSARSRRKIRRASSSRSTISGSSVPCFLPANAPIPILCSGRKTCSRCR